MIDIIGELAEQLGWQKGYLENALNKLCLKEQSERIKKGHEAWCSSDENCHCKGGTL